MTVVCGVQLAPRLADAAANADRIAAEIEAAAREAAELVVFPEAALTGYVFESLEEARDAAVEAGGPEIARLAGACAAAGVHVVCGAIERAGADVFNTAFVVSPDGPPGRYRKIHTLCLGADRFTRAGAAPPGVFRLPFGVIGVHICYDGSFPETARVLRLAGAQLLILPTNWPRLRLKRETVCVRAYENHAFYLAVNRVGSERGVLFEGGSVAADPDGRLLYEAGPAAGRFMVDMDLARADETREVVTPGVYELDLIDDRRPELYGEITRDNDPARRTGSRDSGEPAGGATATAPVSRPSG